MTGMKNRAASMLGAFLLREGQKAQAHPREDQEDPREFEELVLSAGADPVDMILGKRSRPDPKYFVGTGKLDEIAAVWRPHRAVAARLFWTYWRALNHGRESAPLSK